MHVSPYKGHINKPDVFVCIHRHQCARDAYSKAKALGVSPENFVAVTTESDQIATTNHWDMVNRKNLHLVQSYTNKDNIFNVLDAVVEEFNGKKTLLYPGYGFLSERADFREQLEEKYGDSISFMGPSSDSMKKASNKLSFQNLAKKHGLPIIPGHSDELSLIGLKSLQKSLKEGASFEISLKKEDWPVFTIDYSTSIENMQNYIDSIRTFIQESSEINDSTIVASFPGRSLIDIDVEGLVSISQDPLFIGADIRVKATEGGGGSGQSVIKGEWLSIENKSLDRIVEGVKLARDQGTSLFGSGQLMVQTNRTGNFRHIEVKLDGLSTLGLEGTGYIKNLDDSVQLGQFVRPGKPIATQEVMKHESPLALSEDNFPEDAKEGGHLIPLRLGLSDALTQIKEGKRTFTQE